jgi:hypothetical protein
MRSRSARFDPETLTPIGLLMPVASISMRLRMGGGCVKRGESARIGV